MSDQVVMMNERIAELKREISALHLAIHGIYSNDHHDPIEILGLSRRVTNCLIRNDLKEVGQVLNFVHGVRSGLHSTLWFKLGMRNFGEGSWRELVDRLKELNLIE